MIISDVDRAAKFPSWWLSVACVLDDGHSLRQRQKVSLHHRVNSSCAFVDADVIVYTY